MIGPIEYIFHLFLTDIQNKFQFKFQIAYANTLNMHNSTHISCALKYKLALIGKIISFAHDGRQAHVFHIALHAEKRVRKREIEIVIAIAIAIVSIMCSDQLTIIIIDWLLFVCIGHIQAIWHVRMFLKRWLSGAGPLSC